MYSIVPLPAKDVMPTLFSIVFFLQYSIQQSLYMAAVFMSQFPQFCSSTRRRYQFCPWRPTLYYPISIQEYAHIHYLHNVMFLHISRNFLESRENIKTSKRRPNLDPRNWAHHLWWVSSTPFHIPFCLPVQF